MRTMREKCFCHLFKENVMNLKLIAPVLTMSGIINFVGKHIYNSHDLFYVFQNSKTFTFFACIYL